VILLDTSGVIAALNGADPHHAGAMQALRSATPPRLLSPFVLAEIDYLLATRVDTRAELAFLDDVANGAYILAPFGTHDVAEASAVVRKYRDADVGLTDASLVVLARRHKAHDVLTLDERHFRALRPGPTARFRLLPADCA
jgi:predicted nucleic acid-binding protein